MESCFAPPGQSTQFANLDLLRTGSLQTQLAPDAKRPSVSVCTVVFETMYV